jgi:hypothetical protein
MKLTSFTHLAWLVNRIMHAGPDPDLSFQEIFAAARNGKLIGLLAARYSHIADLYFLLSRPSRLEQMEAALRDAASGYDGRVGKPSGPYSSLCLVMDIVIEAMKQQFDGLPLSCPAPQDGSGPEFLPPWTPE